MRRREFFQTGAAALAACALPVAAPVLPVVFTITAIDHYAGTITVECVPGARRGVSLDEWDLVNAGAVARFEVGKPVVWGVKP